ncbi:MAG: hypothetical protein ACSHXL_01950 [Bacteroidota bacterium]
MDESALEVEILNTILPELVPHYPFGDVAPPLNEKDQNNEEKYRNWKLKDSLSTSIYHDKCDSLGMNVLLIDSMYIPNCNLVQWCIENKKVNPLFKKFLDVPFEKKLIENERINDFFNVKIVKRKNHEIWRPDRCIGEVEISRIVFNENHDEAAFIFSCLTEGCIPFGPIHYVVVQKQKGKWVIIEK